MQVILFREQMVLLAGIEFILSLMLVFWLIGVSIGALIPTYLPFDRSNEWWLILSLSLHPLSLMPCTIGIRLMPVVLSVPPQNAFSPWQMLCVSSLTVTPASWLIGFTFPLLAEAFKKALPSDSGASAVGRVFLFESLGSALAGILLILSIVPHWNPFQISFTSLALVLMGIVVLKPRKAIFTAVFLFVLAAMIWDYPSTLERWSANLRWEARHTGYRFVRALETPYQRLELGERDEQYTVFGNGSPLYSFPDEYTYTQWAFMSLSQYPIPTRILFVGNAGGEMYPSYAQHEPEDVAIVEMDAGVMRFTEDRLRFNRMKSPTWIHTDAIRFAADPNWRSYFDLIAINQPDPANAVINRYYTREFFISLKKTLTNDGVIAMTMTGTPSYEKGDTGFLCGTLYWTLRDVFTYVLAVPGTQWWFFASSNRPLLSDIQTITERFNQLRPRISNFSPGIYSIYYDAVRIDKIERSFQSYRNLPRNSETRPLCYLYNLLQWSKQYGYLKWLPVESLAVTGWKLAGLAAFATVVLFVSAFLLVRIVFSRTNCSSAPMIALFIAGFSSLAAETIILLFYQSRVGYLYQHIGLFFGIFMLGLALGVSFRQKTLIRQFSDKPLFREICILVLIFLFSPWVLSSNPLPDSFSIVWTQYLLWIWLLAVAFLMGRILFLVTKCMEGRGSGLSSLAGWIDACDCAGGALGALVTGTFLIPLIGLLNAFYILAGLNALSVLLLWKWKH